MKNKSKGLNLLKNYELIFQFCKNYTKTINIQSMMTLQSTYVCGPHPLMDLLLIVVVWKLFKTLGHATLKIYGS